MADMDHGALRLTKCHGERFDGGGRAGLDTGAPVLDPVLHHHLHIDDQ
ncbi:hypothetical protein RN629_04415 [Sphingomonadaceae bacterium jetA1]|jgi:hypothetical protein